MLSAALPDYTFTAPTLITGTTQHVATSSPGAFAETPGGTTNRSVSIWINKRRSSGGSVVHGHAGFIVADQRGVDRSGRRDRLPGR